MKIIKESRFEKSPMAVKDIKPYMIKAKEMLKDNPDCYAIAVGFRFRRDNVQAYTELPLVCYSKAELVKWEDSILSAVQGEYARPGNQFNDNIEKSHINYYVVYNDKFKESLEDNMKIFKEDLENLESTDNTVVINQPTGAAEEESKEYQKRFEDATKVPEDAPLFGAKDQPVPDEPVEPKITLEESLFESGDTIHVADIDWDTDDEDPSELGLPSELDVPITDILFSNETSIDEIEPEELDDRIAEWLSYSYDWAVRGFNYDDPYEEIEEGINPKDLETIKKAFGEYKSDAAIDGIFSMNGDDPNASKFAKDLADKIDDSMEESLQEGANTDDIKALFDGYISAGDIDMIFGEWDYSDIDESFLKESDVDIEHNPKDRAEATLMSLHNTMNKASRLKHSLVREYQYNIGDDTKMNRIADFASMIDVAIQSALDKINEIKADDEAKASSESKSQDEIADESLTEIFESAKQEDNWSKIYGQLAESYSVHPVHEFDLRVFADKADDFAKAKTIAESFSVQYKVEKSEKAIDDGKLQMTLIIPEEMVG